MGRPIDADALEPDAEYDDGEYWAYSRTQIENAPTIEPEPCEDAVNRKDVINFLCDWICAPGVRCNESSDKCGCIRGIKALPSAQPERNKGRWVRITQGAIPEKYICPFCHRVIENDGVESIVSIRYPFCHCGADMRGEQDEFI